MEHRPVNGKNVKKKKFNIPLIVVSIINLLFTILTVSFVVSLQMVPKKYIILLTGVLLFFNVLSGWLLYFKNKISKIIGYIISIVFAIMSLVGIYYIMKTNNFLNHSFGNNENVYITTYYVLASGDSKTDSIDDISGDTVGYFGSMPYIYDAVEKLNDEVDFEENELDNLYEMFDALNDSEVDAILIDKALYNTLQENDNFYDLDKYQIIYSFDVEIHEKVENAMPAGDSFSIYIGGADFTELYNDFNMIVTVNTKTNKILLTSVPRDYYINIHGKGGKDLIDYASVWGINTSRQSLEDLFGVKIDYHMKINTKSLVGLVDTLGEVQFCSDKAFTTTHALVMGTYDDTKGRKLYVKKGCQDYSGIEILTIARERIAIGGDRQRQQNCQKIMISIMNKLMRPENLLNYNQILNSVSNLYTTNIPRNVVTNLANETLNGAQWTFEMQSVDGRDSTGYVHFSNLVGYVMVPDMKTVEAATDKIKDIESGK